MSRGGSRLDRRGGIAAHDRAGWNVFKNHASRADDAPFANFDSRTDERARGHPASRAQSDRFRDEIESFRAMIVRAGAQKSALNTVTRWAIHFYAAGTRVLSASGQTYGTFLDILLAYDVRPGEQKALAGSAPGMARDLPLSLGEGSTPPRHGTARAIFDGVSPRTGSLRDVHGPGQTNQANRQPHSR